MSRPARVTGTNNPNRQVSVNAWNAVVDKSNEVASVEDYGAVGDGVADDTAAIAAALAANPRIRMGSKTYIVSSLVIPSGRTIETAATIIKQAAGTADGTRIVTVVNGASNVIVGDLTVEGQIATSGGEQNHAIYIRAQTADVSNIKFGNIRAVNIRGDAVYIGAYSGYSADQVTVGNIVCDNVYRNGLTISGCGRVSVGDVSGLAGYSIIDIEPEPTYTKCGQIRIGNVKGRQAVIASSSATNVVETVEIAALDLDPTYYGDSSPAYSFTLSHGLQHRNTKSIRIGTLRANGYNGQAIKQIWSAGELATQAIHIEHCILSDCANTETTYQAYLLGNQGVTKLSIGHLEVSATASADNIVRGYSFASIGVVTATLASGSNLFRAVDDSTVGNLLATGGIIANSCNRTSLLGGSVNGERLFSNCSGCLADNLTSTQSVGQLVGTVSNITIRKSTLGGTYNELLFYANSTTATASIAVNGDMNTGGVILSRATSPSGYANGAGGSVTQGSSKTAGVTLNSVCGEVVMNAASLSGGASASFTLTNSKVAANDEVAVWIKSGATADSYTLSVTAVSAGQVRIQLRNISAGALAEAVVIGFAVRRSVVT